LPTSALFCNYYVLGVEQHLKSHNRITAVSLKKVATVAKDRQLDYPTGEMICEKADFSWSRLNRSLIPLNKLAYVML